jgi:CheY-like chemotaxis protein
LCPLFPENSHQNPGEEAGRSFMNGENRKTILLVEDEVLIAMTEEMTLGECGYSIIIAYSGDEAVKTVEKTPKIDLILMDINLGDGIDGTEAAKIILKNRKIPIVFLSSHTEPEVVEKTEMITSYGYVVKHSGITVLDASIKMAFKLFDANQKIVESEVKQNAMISNISDVIAVVDADGILSFISSNVEKWFGWIPEDRVGHSSWSIIHPDDMDRIQKEFSSILEQKHAAYGGVQISM